MPDSKLDEDRLRRLIEVGRPLVSGLDLEPVLDQLLEVAQEITGARYAALGVLDEEKRSLERFLTAGIDEQTGRTIGALPRGRGVLGLLIEDPRPLRIDDVVQHPHSYGFPAGHPEMHSFLGVPVIIRGQAWGNLYLTEKAGGDFDSADEEAAMILAGWVAIAIDNARLFDRVQRRRDELERVVRNLEASTDIALAVGGETDLRRVLELIAKRARALVEASSVVILMRDQQRDLVVAATAGEVPEDLGGARVPVRGSVAGHVLETRQPERLADLTSRSRFALGALGIKATTGLFVPLVFRGQAVGVLEAFDHRGEESEFGAEDERVLSSFAASAAIAIATAKAVQEDRLRHSLEASEQERSRWARELHDETLQALGSVKLLLSSARRAGDQQQLQVVVDGAIAQLGEELESLRSLIAELRPAALDEIGLAAALEALVQRTAARNGLDIALSVEVGEAGGELHPELESTIYRLVQEVVTNIVKHAGAQQVEIEVVRHAGEIEVRVRDDGEGFDTEAETSGFGLTGMRERVGLAGGDLAILSSQEGTVVHATVPLKLSQAASENFPTASQGDTGSGGSVP